MVDKKLAPYAILLLRIICGIALILHSAYLKIFVFTMDGTIQFFESLGLPWWGAWITLIIEISTGIMLILGIKPRLGAIIAIPGLLGATWAHSGNGWLFSNTGGGWEYPLFWTLSLLVIALAGDGKMTLISTSNKE